MYISEPVSIQSDSRTLVNAAARAVVVEIWLHRGNYGIDRGTEAEQFQQILVSVQSRMAMDLPAVVYEEFRRIIQDAEDAADAEIEMRGEVSPAELLEEDASGDQQGTTGGDPEAGE